MNQDEKAKFVALLILLTIGAIISHFFIHPILTGLLLIIPCISVIAVIYGMIYSIIKHLLK